MDGRVPLPGGERLKHFIFLLADEDPSNRWKAIEVLAREGDVSAVDPLITALSDPDWRVRQKAAWALGRLGDQKALVPLRRALRGESEGVKEIILEAISEITMRSRE
ncbi:MAG: HEAT repeat protein [Methanoregulaceae archaeon PtaU1.Bin059]|nr:MAG: HEAT repeat protein [Methanoregulaceae archaeon PtaU1.Bin059]